MGLLSWIRGNRGKSPQPPWVRPEFLGLFALIAMASLGLGYWAVSSGGSEPGAVAAETKHEYVGIEPDQLGARLLCEPACHPDSLFEAWVRDHPGAQVLSKEPRYHQGVLIGYDLEYRDA